MEDKKPDPVVRGELGTEWNPNAPGAALIFDDIDAQADAGEAAPPALPPMQLIGGREGARLGALYRLGKAGSGVFGPEVGAPRVLPPEERPLRPGMTVRVKERVPCVGDCLDVIHELEPGALGTVIKSESEGFYYVDFEGANHPDDEPWIMSRDEIEFVPKRIEFEPPPELMKLKGKQRGKPFGDWQNFCEGCLTELVVRDSTTRTLLPKVCPQCNQGLGRRWSELK